MSQAPDGQQPRREVVVGPWPGSTAHPVPAPQPQAWRRFGRGAIPQRYRQAKTGQRLLMECKNPKCRAPFNPNFPVPRDLLCAACRTAEDEQYPPLIPRSELEQRGPHSDG